ncbi:UNVERIFIED_CONTAM: hypothetical protein K2H54_048480 [Gekko kuhli]
MEVEKTYITTTMKWCQQFDAMSSEYQFTNVTPFFVQGLSQFFVSFLFPSCLIFVTVLNHADPDSGITVTDAGMYPWQHCFPSMPCNSSCHKLASKINFTQPLLF